MLHVTNAQYTKQFGNQAYKSNINISADRKSWNNIRIKTLDETLITSVTIVKNINLKMINFGQLCQSQLNSG